MVIVLASSAVSIVGSGIMVIVLTSSAVVVVGSGIMVIWSAVDLGL